MGKGLPINQIICGDCLDIMRSWEDGQIDAVITDPPYSSGGQFRGDRTQATSVKYVNSDSVATCRANFSGDNRDQRSFLLWCSLWLGQCLRVSKPGAVAMMFTDWRQLPTCTDAVQLGGWVWRNIVTWWKPGCRMQRGRPSSSAEYVVYASNGIPAEGECSEQNVIPMQGVPGEDKEHIAEKPLELMTKLVGLTPPGSLILDPFCGSGTTCRAAQLTGRRYIGIELDPVNCDIARDRLQAIDTGVPVKEAKSGQLALFGAHG